MEQEDVAKVLAEVRHRPTVSVEVAGQILGLSRNSSYQAAGRGDIPVLRIGRRLLVPTAKLLELLGLEQAS